MYVALDPQEKCTAGGRVVERGRVDGRRFEGMSFRLSEANASRSSRLYQDGPENGICKPHHGFHEEDVLYPCEHCRASFVLVRCTSMGASKE